MTSSCVCILRQLHAPQFFRLQTVNARQPQTFKPRPLAHLQIHNDCTAFYPVFKNQRLPSPFFSSLKKKKVLCRVITYKTPARPAARTRRSVLRQVPFGGVPRSVEGVVQRTRLLERPRHRYRGTRRFRKMLLQIRSKYSRATRPLQTDSAATVVRIGEDPAYRAVKTSVATLKTTKFSSKFVRVL